MDRAQTERLRDCAYEVATALRLGLKLDPVAAFILRVSRPVFRDGRLASVLHLERQRPARGQMAAGSRGRCSPPSSSTRSSILPLREPVPYQSKGTNSPFTQSRFLIILTCRHRCKPEEVEDDSTGERRPRRPLRQWMRDSAALGTATGSGCDVILLRGGAAVRSPGHCTRPPVGRPQYRRLPPRRCFHARAALRESKSCNWHGQRAGQSGGWVMPMHDGAGLELRIGQCFLHSTDPTCRHAT